MFQFQYYPEGSNELYGNYQLESSEKVYHNNFDKIGPIPHTIFQNCKCMYDINWHDCLILRRADGKSFSTVWLLAAIRKCWCF